MLFEGCQGRKGPQVQEKLCPNCGSPVELISTDIYTECEECGCLVFSDEVECIQHCSKAKECMGESQYARLMEARKKWEEQMMQDDDQW